jgi:RHS repeat-associated protein
MMMPGRKYSAGSLYRYGFQGQESDNEIKGEGNSINYQFRVYDPRLGRFLSTDPIKGKYPFYSPYHFSSNQPIHASELEGLESTFDLSIPNSPQEVDLGHWTPNTKFKAPNGIQWLNKEGYSLTFDKGQPGADGWLGKDHWHVANPQGKRLNASGAIASGNGGNNDAHLTPGTKTSIKLQASVTSTEINGLDQTTTKTTPTPEEKPVPGKGGLMKAIIIVDVMTTFSGIVTGDPDAAINRYGGAKPGELKSGRLRDLVAYQGQVDAYAEYYMITSQSINEWTENGVKYKTITNTVQHYESKRYDKKQGRYVGESEVGPKFERTQTYKNGKLVDGGETRAVERTGSKGPPM